LLPAKTPVARFKHITGEFATASAIALWLACYILRKQQIPEHMWKANPASSFKKAVIYNNHKGIQHSFLLCKLD
jgi:3-oxoacyl-(acyl-carrier-protein) synthase